MFVLTRITVVHGAAHAAPLGNVVSIGFYKGSLGETLVPRRGTQRHRSLQGGAISRPGLVFPRVSKDSGKPCSESRCAFLAQQKPLILKLVLFYTGFDSFWTFTFFWPRILPMVLKTQALSMLYVPRQVEPTMAFK